MTLRRVYFTCRRCGLHAHALDDRLGLDGFVSPHAQRLICLTGAERSFERAARMLRDVAGLVLCDNTVRKICDRHGGLMRAWQREAPEAPAPSARPTGTSSSRPMGPASIPPAAGGRCGCRSSPGGGAASRSPTWMIGTSSGCRPRTSASRRRRSVRACRWVRSGGGRRPGWG